MDKSSLCTANNVAIKLQDNTDSLKKIRINQKHANLMKQRLLKSVPGP